MQNSTHRTVWAILCLFALAVTAVIGIGLHYPSPESMLATLGSVQFATSLIVAAVAWLSVWLWKKRDLGAKTSSLPPKTRSRRLERKAKSKKTILESVLEPTISPDTFQELWSSARRNVGVAEAVLNHIRMHMNLCGNGCVAIGTVEDALLMKWVLENEYVRKDDIAKAVHERLCEIGRIMYEWHMCAPLVNYPDHLASPEALGYAILHGAISAEEAGKICFDHGETADEYCKMAEGLHESVMQQLADGPQPLARLPSTDGGMICEGCGQ